MNKSSTASGVQTYQLKMEEDVLPLLLEEAYRVRKDLYEDYKYLFNSFDDFLAACHKESGFARSLTYRFLSFGRGQEIIRIQLQHFREVASRDFFASPLFYLRFSEPGFFLNKKHSNSLLYTEPHYDRSRYYDFYSIWIPLNNTNRDTGTLCTFPGLEEVHTLVRDDGTNYYSLSSYLSDAVRLDRIFEPFITPIGCRQGSYLAWDSSVLHGATKSLSLPRVSINYQVFKLSEDISDYDFGNIEFYSCLLYNLAPLHFCAIMLLSYNDLKGFYSLMSHFSVELLAESRELSVSDWEPLRRIAKIYLYDKQEIFIPSKERVHWKNDYSLLESILFSSDDVVKCIEDFMNGANERI